MIGDRRKFLTALITLDEAVAQKLAPEVPADQLAAAPSVRAAVQKQVDAVNQTLARVEQIKKFTILPRAFTIASGELTPTMKLKRKVIAQRYATEIDAMYADGERDEECRNQGSAWSRRGAAIATCSAAARRRSR